MESMGLNVGKEKATAKKKQKKAKSANGPENGAGAESAADGAVEEPGAASAAEVAGQEGHRPSSEAEPRNPAKKNSKASGKGDKDAGGPSQLREAAIDVLNGQARLQSPLELPRTLRTTVPSSTRHAATLCCARLSELTPRWPASRRMACTSRL